jgi:hypothetical protein
VTCVFLSKNLLYSFDLTLDNRRDVYVSFLFFFQGVQLDLDVRSERLASLTKELEEMTADGRADADMATLRRSKNELELKVKDQVQFICLFFLC